jgi:hypothetical protein
MWMVTRVGPEVEAKEGWLCGQIVPSWVEDGVRSATVVDPPEL